MAETTNTVSAPESNPSDDLDDRLFNLPEDIDRILDRVRVVDLALGGIAGDEKDPGVMGVRAIVWDVLDELHAVAGTLAEKSKRERDNPMFDALEAEDERHEEARAAIFEEHRYQDGPTLAQCMQLLQEATKEQREFSAMLAQFVEQQRGAAN